MILFSATANHTTHEVICQKNDICSIVAIVSVSCMCCMTFLRSMHVYVCGLNLNELKRTHLLACLFRNK